MYEYQIDLVYALFKVLCEKVLNIIILIIIDI